MFLKLLIRAGLLTFCLGHVAATGCHELQQTQLNLLNERMNQMINTISSLLPKSLKKLTPPVPTTPAPTLEYIPSTGHETNYYFSPQTPSTPPPIPQIVYVSPSYAPVPSPVGMPPWHPNPVPTPFYNYIRTETGPYREYPSSTVSSFVPQAAKYNYQYEQPLQYPNPMLTTRLTPPSFPPGPLAVIQSPHPPEYTHPYLLEYPFPVTTYISNPEYAPGPPLLPFPVQIPPSTYVPAYSQSSNIPLHQA